MAGVAVDVNKGDAGLLLKIVHVLHDGALGLAHVDDHLRAAGEQRLQIQLALAAVQLAQQGQIIVLLVRYCWALSSHSLATPTSLSGHRANSTI